VSMQSSPLVAKIRSVRWTVDRQTWASSDAVVGLALALEPEDFESFLNVGAGMMAALTSEGFVVGRGERVRPRHRGNLAGDDGASIIPIRGKSRKTNLCQSPGR
jgi:hypothetical protein